MKKIYTALLLVAGAQYCAAQSLLSEPYPQPASNANFYYENKGQIIDHADNLRPDVLYYTEQGFPKTFILQDGIALTHALSADTTIPGTTDTLLRIDMNFVCDKKPGKICGKVVPYEISQDHLNYYLPHCPNGITEVKGYARIVYENAFPNIDVHLYSNSVAMKLYFVVKPGGDPGQISLQFQGQDSIAQMTNGDLRMYLKTWKMSLAQAYAYTIDNSQNASVLSWLPTWNHNGSGGVNISTGSYNTANTLVIAVGGDTPTPLAIDNMDWSVYYGAEGEQRDARVCSGPGTTIYHAMSIWDHNHTFPGQNGFTPDTRRYYDWYVSKFENTSRKWGTHYGGAKLDQVAAIASNAGGSAAPNTGVIWVAGITCSKDAPDTGSVLPQYSVFKQAKDAGQGGQALPESKYDGLLASFEDDGKLKYATYFGGTSDDIIKQMYIDPEQQLLYIAGHTKGSNNFSNSPLGQTNGHFPLYSGGTNNYYFKNQKCAVDREDGFIAQFDIKNMSLMWSTLFGGSGMDNITSISAKDNHVYIGGQTWNNDGGLNQMPSPASAHNTCNFPLSNPNDGSFFQNSNNVHNKNMFLAAFNPDRQLYWSTLLGFSVEGLMDIAFNSKAELLCLGGYNISDLYAPPGTAPNGQGLTPLYDNGSSYFQGQPASPAGTNTLMKFSPARKLLWSTPLAYTDYIGGTAQAEITKRHRTANLIVDQDRIFTTTVIGGINLSTTAPSGTYLQSQNASNAAGNPGSDTYLISLDAGEQLSWATYFGGGSSSNNLDYENDMPTAICVQSPYLYLTGQTQSVNGPYIHCIPQNVIPNSYCDQSYYLGAQNYSFTFDVFISRFKVDQLPSGIAKHGAKGNISCNLYPNPVQQYTHLSISSSKSLKVSIGIYDNSGRLLRSIPQVLRKGLNAFKLDCRELAAGQYYITVSGEGVYTNHKMTKL